MGFTLAVRRVTISFLLLCLAIPPVAHAAVTAQFWRELGGSGSGDGVSQSAFGIGVVATDRDISVAVGPDGRPVVAYTDAASAEEPEFAVFVKRWTGATWEMVGGGPLSEPGREVETPRVKVAPNGEIFVAWRQVPEEFPGYEIYLLKWNGSSWVAPAGTDADGHVTHSLHQGVSPASFALALTPGGRPVIAFSAPTLTEADFVRFNSQILSDQVYVLRWGTGGWGYLGTDQSGGGASGAPTFKFNFTPSGLGFDLFDLAQHAAVRPSVAVDPGGNIFVTFIYTSSFISNAPPWDSRVSNDVYVVRWDVATSSWRAVGPGVPTGASAAGLGEPGGISASEEQSVCTRKSPSIAVGVDGRPVVAWGEGDCEGSWVRVKKFDGTTWNELGAPGLSDFNGTASNVFAAVEIGGDGNPIVAWQHFTSSTGLVIWLKRFNSTASAWVEMGAGSATGPGIGGFGTGGINSSGYVPWIAVGPPPARNPVVIWVEQHLSDSPQLYLRAFNPGPSPARPTALPTVTGVSPLSGMVGAAVTITGTSLATVTTVRFNGVATSPISQTATSVQTRVPAGATTGRISVQNPTGTATSLATFKVLPKIIGFSPSGAPAGSATVITVTGSNLKIRSTVPTVKIGTFAVAAASLVSSSATSVVFRIPIGAITGKISITTADGTATSARDLIVVQPPRPVSFAPVSGAVGTLVTITGTKLAGATGVTFAGAVTVTPTLVTATSLKATVPAGARTGPVRVTNAAGTGSSAAVFKVRPKINSFAPPSAGAGSDTIVSVNGTNLVAATGAPVVKVGTFIVPATRVVSATRTRIQFRVPLGAVTGKIGVTTVDGTAISASDLVVGQRLLSDGFSGPLSANWIIIIGAGTSFPSSVTSGDADTLGSPPHGNPSPGLWMKGASFGASPGGGGGVESFNNYPTSNGLTVSVDARRDSGHETAGGNGIIFSLTDINPAQPAAWIRIDSNSVRYFLKSGPSSGQVESIRFYPVDTAFHHFVFTVDASGNAEWRRDGVLQRTVTGFPLNQNFHLKATSPGSTDTVLGSAHIDNVLVTTP